jgi:hypothetical protein
LPKNDNKGKAGNSSANNNASSEASGWICRYKLLVSLGATNTTIKTFRNRSAIVEHKLNGTGINLPNLNIPHDTRYLALAFILEWDVQSRRSRDFIVPVGKFSSTIGLCLGDMKDLVDIWFRRDMIHDREGQEMEDCEYRL